MATTNQKPLNDLMYDWITILHEKSKGLEAYEKYLKDAEAANAPECVTMLKKIHEADTRQLEEIRDHVFRMVAKQQGGK
jgi:hypothetical protein